jgi:hypothetical protein
LSKKFSYRKRYVKNKNRKLLLKRAHNAKNDDLINQIVESVNTSGVVHNETVNENTVTNELLIPQDNQTQQASSSNISIFKINKKSKTNKTISNNPLTNYFHVIPKNIDTNNHSSQESNLSVILASIENKMQTEDDVDKERKIISIKNSLQNEFLQLQIPKSLSRRSLNPSSSSENIIEFNDENRTN